jgi:hypothetical protein
MQVPQRVQRSWVDTPMLTRPAGMRLGVVSAECIWFDDARSMRSQSTCFWKLSMNPCLLQVVASVVLGVAAAAESFPESPGEGAVLLDLGTMEAKANLGYGWSLAEANGGRRYRWIKSLEAQMWVDLPEAADRTIWVEVASQYLPYTRQVLAVYINRRFAGEWVMDHEPGFDVYRLPVDAERWRTGRNEILLRAAFRVRVGTDPRELSICVDRILVEAR